MKKFLEVVFLVPIAIVCGVLWLAWAVWPVFLIVAIIMWWRQ